MEEPMDGMDVNTIANLAMILAFVALFANVLLGFFLERLAEYVDRNRGLINRIEHEIEQIKKPEDPWNHMKNW